MKHPLVSSFCLCVFFAFVISACLQRGGHSSEDSLTPVDNRPLDILFVIDNSASMNEETENLAYNASSVKAGGNPCDAEGFDQLLSYKSGHPDTPPEDWQEPYPEMLEACGFIELLQLHQNRFHIGIITTSMDDCDEVRSADPRPSVPQRGCLQTGVAHPSLTVLTWQTPHVGHRFADILSNVGTGGSAYEKGLQAAEVFLTQRGEQQSQLCDLPRDCSSDLQDFLRETDVVDGQEVPTRLLTVFVTDEDDCSHNAAIDENNNVSLCYQKDLLVDTSHFVDLFLGLKDHPKLVSGAVIGGFFDDGRGPEPSGCKPDGMVVTNQCTPSHGASIAVCDVCSNGEPICPCHPAIAAENCDGVAHPATNCCQADAAERYYEVVTQMSSHSLQSICSASFFAPLTSIVEPLLEE